MTVNNEELSAVALTPTVSVGYRSATQAFSKADIVGDFQGTTAAEDPSIIAEGGTTAVPTLTDKDGNVLSPIDSEFGFEVFDFFEALTKERDGDYGEGWAGNIIGETGDILGLALVNAETDRFKSGQPLGTWAAGLGGNTVKASTEHYSVMQALLSNQAYAGDPDAAYSLDNNLIVIGYERDDEGALIFDDEGNLVPTEFNGLSVDEALAELASEPDGGDVNGDGVLDIKDVLTPNESTVTENIAASEDYSVTLKDDGKLLYRWGTAIKRPNDIRMQKEIALPEAWKLPEVSQLNDGRGYKVSLAELIINHDITNNPNDQIRPEDYENEGATGRKPSYYVIQDPDNAGNTLWVSPVDSYGGDGSFLPSYFRLTESGEVDLSGGGESVFDPDDNLMGYRNTDASGNVIGTVLRDFSLIGQNNSADLPFTSSDIEAGYTTAWYISTNRDPFEWSYDSLPNDDFRQVYVGFANRDEAEAAGFDDSQLVSGPRWRLKSNKFGQDIPGVEIPLKPNSKPPFKEDNIRYEVGHRTTTTINLLDWEDSNGNGVSDDSPLGYSNGWTIIDPARLDADGDGVTDEGWSDLVYDETGNLISASTPEGAKLLPDFDVSAYLKGDRKDSAKIYDVQLRLEYEADPALTTLYDYGDAPDDDAALNYQTHLDQAVAKAKVLPGFYLGQPLTETDGTLVGTPEIDAEENPLASADALGDDTTGQDDEGGITFTTPFLPGQSAAIDVSASLQEYLFDAAGNYTGSNTQAGFLSGWIDYNNNGSWDADEQIQFETRDPLGNVVATASAATLAEGTQTLIFTVPEIAQVNAQTFARFRLSPAAVGAYGTTGNEAFDTGEIEDYQVLVSNAFTDVLGQKEDGSWWAGLSDGDRFKTVQYGQWDTATDWTNEVAADINGDGIDDVVAYSATTGAWATGVTLYDPTKSGLERWSFVSNESYSTQPAWQEALAVDFNGDGIDEVAGRNAAGTWQLLPAYEGGASDITGEVTGSLPTWGRQFSSVHTGDFNGDGRADIAGLQLVDTATGTEQRWSVLSYEETGGEAGFDSSLWQSGAIANATEALAGDFDGDGLDDVATREANGQWSVSLSDGSSFAPATSWGSYDAAWQAVDAGDLNGDGKDDIALFNAEAVSWQTGLSDGSSFSFQKRPSKWFIDGGWTDLQVQDFTGDGIDDVAARRADGRWTVGTFNGIRIKQNYFGRWDKEADWQTVVAGNFDGGNPDVVEVEPTLEEIVFPEESNVLPAAVDPGLVNDVDQPLNDSPDYRVKKTFELGGVIGSFDGRTYADDPSIISQNEEDTKLTKDGITLYGIDSEFGFEVTDFEGGTPKELDGVYTEGWVGELLTDQTDPTSDVVGLVVSDAPTDTLQAPYLLGSWLVGMGGDAVKASTEHYVTMQNVLSDQKYPGDPDAVYPLDNNLIVIGGTYGGQAVSDVITALEGDPEGDRNEDGVIDILDVLDPNESSVTGDIARSSDYSVTLKDDGKLLYRWGNLVKRPNDIRVRAELPLPEEWDQGLFKVNQAELVVRHTISNNPNDQIRPEDYENEAAIGRLPSYEETEDGKWVSTEDFYAGDGTFLPTGTVLKDPTIVENSQDSSLADIGALSADLTAGLTNAWYTTQDREPFEAVLDGDGYEVGPRWRLKSNKYGQDLPGVEIPFDPAQAPPLKKEQIKYETGAETQTVLNLLDWEAGEVSPLQLSAGWQLGAGSVSSEGLALSDSFDIAFYVKGDQKPLVLYDTELLLSYEAVDTFGSGTDITGSDGEDILVGEGDNLFSGGSASDTFVLSYGAADIMASTISDFSVEEDFIGLINLGVSTDNFSESITQEITDIGLNLALNGSALTTLNGVNTELGIDRFYLA